MNFVKKFLNFKNIIIGILCLVIVFAPIVVDYSNLPRGYEISKVFFINAFAALISLLYAISIVLKYVKRKRFPDVKKKGTIIFFVLVFFMSLSSLFSPHQSIAYFGNSFRFQGFYTHLLLILAGFVLYKTLQQKHIKPILISFVLSGLIQSIVGVNQFIYFSQNNPTVLKDGLWINGTFGQANWFAGRLLIVVFICCFIFLRVNFKNKILQNIVKFISVITLTLSIGAIVFSNATWANMVLLFSMVIFFLIQIPAAKVKYFAFFLLILSIIGINLYTVFFNNVFDLHSQIPRKILNVLNADQNPFRYLFGYGFDTLGEVFKHRNIFQGALIDRAHNFFFDLIAQGGFFLFGIVNYLVLRLVISIKNTTNQYFYLFVFLTLVWILRSSIHESGIVNLLDFVILISISLKLRKTTPEVSD